MTSTVCSCKVGTVADSCGFPEIHDRLAAQWTDDDHSVRDLTEQFNRRLVRAGFEQADRIPIDGEIENLYRVLTDDDVDAGTRTQARERLRQDGVPIEEIESQFVSHQTVYRHLRNCLGVSRDDETETATECIDSWRDRIDALRARTAAVTDRGVSQLASQDAIDGEAFDVLVDITVICDDCGQFYDLDELFEGRGCDCASTPAGTE
ncbi:rod-determining factor RdfA [Halobacteriaceae archaeon SHR40]|uniref:rod-determining factor RdfA n=1 Tax=Halovenus amylolytica TaxID=2500550 RepID=UPI000FE42880